MPKEMIKLYKILLWNEVDVSKIYSAKNIYYFDIKFEHREFWIGSSRLYNLTLEPDNIRLEWILK